MKIETYSHPDFKHKFIITEEILEYGPQKRWVMQQLDERGSILPREAVLNKSDYDKMIEQLSAQGWKTLLEE